MNAPRKPKAKRLVNITPNRRHDLRVTFSPGWKPEKYPHDTGTVFLSKGRETVVKWDDGTMANVATVALETIPEPITKPYQPVNPESVGAGYPEEGGLW